MSNRACSLPRVPNWKNRICGVRPCIVVLRFFLGEKRAIETGQKVILGGMLISIARKDPQARAWVIRQSRAQVTRKIDLNRLQPLLEELEGLGQGQGAIPAGNGADKAQEGV